MAVLPPTLPAPRHWRLGAGWMVVAALFFALLGVFVKQGSRYFGPLELLFYRTLFGALVLGALCLVRRENPWTAKLSGHVKRALIGYLSMCALFYALARLPLSTAITLNYTSSLFFVLVCVVKLREPMDVRSLLIVLLGFAGIVWLLHPTFRPDLWRAGVVGLSSGAFAGMAVFQVRELGRMGEAPWRIVFWFFTFSTLLGGGAVRLEGGFHPLVPAGIGPLVGVGVTGLLGQLAMTRAYKEGRKYLVSSLAYLTVVFSVLFGWWWWHDGIGWDGMAAMGLIVLSGLMAARR